MLPAANWKNKSLTDQKKEENNEKEINPKAPRTTQDKSLDTN
jgi:hypothetical protein